MPSFQDAAEVYRSIGALLQELASDPELAPRFREADTVVQFQYRDPEARITVRLRQDAEVRVDLGETDLEPEVVMAMDADTAHRFWLGRVNVSVALARGQILAEGPVAKILQLVPLTEPVFPRYEARLRETGREDLLAG